MIKRMHSASKGARFSAAKTGAYSAFYVALGFLFCAISFYEGVPLWLAAPYAVLFAGVAFWSYRYSDSRITFWKARDGSVYFKGGTIIYFIYLVGLVARLLINAIVVKSGTFSFNPGIALSGAPLYGAIATDVLLLFGVSLLLGRSMKALKRYQMIERGEETLPGGQGT